MNPKKQLKYNNLKERQKLSWEGMFYSTQRMDLLIISISGGGIYAALEALKYLQDYPLLLCKSTVLIKAAGIFLLFSIIANFISQYFGHKSNREDWLMTDCELEGVLKKKTLEIKASIKAHDKKAEKFTKLTRYTNNTSMMLMIVGLLALLLVFLIF